VDVGRRRLLPAGGLIEHFCFPFAWSFGSPSQLSIPGTLGYPAPYKSTAPSVHRPHPLHHPSDVHAMADDTKSHRSGDVTVRGESPVFFKDDMYGDGSVDPVYQAKSRVLNQAMQEIGMGRYQVRTVPLQVFPGSELKPRLSGRSSSWLVLAGFRTACGRCVLLIPACASGA
jgi:hypothetical protein